MTIDSWQEIENEQRKLCNRLNLIWTPFDTQLMIAFNTSLLTKCQPINGLRHPRNGNIDGWFLWSGGEIPNDDETFFQPTHVEHLINKKPIVLKYLGLPFGYRFQIDDNGYEDIWFDSSILLID